jgi:hypothetical protein
MDAATLAAKLVVDRLRMSLAQSGDKPNRPGPGTLSDAGKTLAALATNDNALATGQDLVTLDQAAAMVHRSKRTLERFKTRGSFPAPAVEGGGGRADLFEWSMLRTWLTGEFGIRLPDKFPRDGGS